MTDADRYVKLKRTIQSHRNSYAGQADRAPAGSEGRGMASAMAVALETILTEIEILDSLS